MSSDTDIRTYNAFGMAVVRRESIRIVITLFRRHRIVCQPEPKECDLEQVGPDESILSTFGVLIVPGEKPQITSMQHSNMDSGLIAMNIPEVAEAVQEAITDLEKSTFRS